MKLELISPTATKLSGNRKGLCNLYSDGDNFLDIRYEATTTPDHHQHDERCFNLSGDPANHSITEDELYVNAATFTPVDSTFMTTGKILPVAGTPMDFTQPKQIGRDINRRDFDQIAFGNGYDHNFVLDTQRDDSVAALECYSPASGIVLKVYTDETGHPGLFRQLSRRYHGGRKSVTYQQRSASASEDASIRTTLTSRIGLPPCFVPEKRTAVIAFAFATR